MPKIFLTPSNQPSNVYAYGNTNEMIQAGLIAEACKNALIRCGFEVKVAHQVPLEEKIKQSNAWKADLHIPIHTNAYNGKVTGTRMFYYDTSVSGYKQCQAIFNVLAPFTPGTSENMKSNKTLDEMKLTKAPAVYIEVDFHDVPEIAKWIINNTKSIGEKICEGICNYYGKKYIVEYNTAELEKEIVSLKAENANLKGQVSEFQSKIANAQKALQ